MEIIAVIGTGRESGKTLTTESLVKELSSRGYSLGAIKQIHEEDFSMDTPDKDTWRLTKAGAKVVVAAAPNEVTAIKSVAGNRFEAALGFLEGEDLDLVLVEGNPPVDVPRILAANDPETAKGVLSKTPLMCISSYHPEKFSREDFEIPIFHPLKGITEMADLVESNIKK